MMNTSQIYEQLSLHHSDYLYCKATVRKDYSAKSIDSSF